MASSRLMGANVPSSVALADRIEYLESEERAAVRRGDWSTATRLASEKAALKEARQRAAAGGGDRDPPDDAPTRRRGRP